MSSFNIFGSATKKDIRVGYVDPDRGYVQNVSILEANRYAALNPGTVFILYNRDKTRYLTINEVNALTPDVLEVDGNVCEGIQGLKPNERPPFTAPFGSGGTGDGTGTTGGTGDGTGTTGGTGDGTGTTGGTGDGTGTTGGTDAQLTGSGAYDDGCRGRLYLSGGGGVGAVGSPIFGRDGSLLAVRVLAGGFGYRYEPKAKLIDTCKRGSGAVIRTVIGELPPTVEYFDQIEDFEVYDFTPDGTELSGYGNRFGPNGEDLGAWDPNLFATLAQDPIGAEIQRYQEFLRQGINPFWHTRKENPLSVTFRDKTTRVIHKVTDKGYRERRRKAGVTDDFGWSDWMNKYAVSPVPESNAPGSDYAGRVATMEWEEDFPYTGEYVFRGMADNIGKLYLDNELLIQTGQFGGLNAKNVQPKNTVRKTVQEGVHRIKVDLFNIPRREKPKPKKPQDLTITYHGLNQGSTKTSGEKEYPITYEKLNSSNQPNRGRGARGGIRVENNGKRIELKDGKGDDANVRFEIRSTSPGVSAKFSDDGRELKVKGSGDVTIRLKYDDNPNYAGEAVRSITIAGTKWRKERKHKGEETKTIKVGASKEVVGKGGYIVSGDQKKVKMKDGHGDDINSTFSIASSTNNARFSNDGKRIESDGPGEVKLKLEWNDDPKKYGVAVDKIEVGGVVLDQRGKKGSDTKTLVIQGAPNPSTSSNQSQSTGTVFNTADFIGKANRKLWRTNVYNRGGFLGESGVCPFNTRKPLDDNPYSGTHLILWEGINFPADGNYKIDVEVDDRVKLFIGNRDGAGAANIGNGLIDVNEGGDEVIIEKNGFVGDSNKGTGKSTYTKFFKKGKYRIRAELYQKPGGRFAFDGDGQPSSTKVTARFVRRGGENYLKVDGSGSAEISFRLRTDDNPRTSGVFADKVRIGLPPNDFVELKRTRTGVGGRGNSKGRIKEKEVITGSAVFEAGREYLVKTFGSSRTTGSVLRNSGNTIEYDDNIDNGFDENADLSITRIKNLDQKFIKGINPMALAVNIDQLEVEEARISPQSFNENPMGAAFTIDAPLPPIPQEPPIEGEGRCPKNPIWTTRFPGAQKKWWPVTHPAWSKFTNRFALSPLPPLSTLNSDGGGGITYSNTWDIDIPYDGFYGVKGTADNAGRVLIDGQEVYKFKGFKNQSPKIEKVKILEGKHTITVEVVNFRQENTKTVKKKVFNTQDWIKPLTEGPPNPAELTVEYRGLNQGITKPVSGDKNYPIQFEDLNPSNRRIEVSGKNSTNQNDTLKLRDGKGSDANVKFTIMSTSPGVSAKFSNDGRQLLTKGRGNVTIRLKYDDNPNYAGEAVRSITIAGKKWRKERKHKGEETHTINVGSKDTTEVVGKGGYRVSGNSVKMRDGHGNDINSTFSIVSSTVDAKFSSDGKRIEYKGSGKITLKLQWNDDPKKYGVAVDSIAVGGKVWNQRGEKGSKVQTIDVTAESNIKGGLKSGASIGGVNYDGPLLFNHKNKSWSQFMNKNNVSPYLPPLDVDNNDLPGDRTFTWSNVDFFENGRYEFKFQSDDVAKLFINGQEVLESRSFRGEALSKFVELSAGRYEVKVLLNNLRFTRNKFINNPTGFALKIFKDVKVVVSTPAWTSNPLCASAILIPPPCPKVVKGRGVVTDIIPLEPGNGYPSPPSSGPPVTLVLKDIVPTSPGINYDPDDLIFIDGKPVTPRFGPFGQVEGIEPVPYYGFTAYPNITLPSESGVGFRGRPVFEPVIVPELVLPEDQLLQVTDLVGLKQTGYVNGKPYYGSTFSKDGILYAGVYETTGDLIQVYATLQESIDGQVTTRASAILRQGTDVTSNDPRLDIPNTPDNLI